MATGQWWRREGIEFAGLAIGVIGLVLAVAFWLWPRPATSDDASFFERDGIVGFSGGCDTYRLVAQNRWDPFGAAARAGPDPLSERVGSFGPNELVAVDGWVHSEIAYPTNAPPWDSDIWFHLADGSGWVISSDVIEIQAPAADVWKINVEEFTQIGKWARAISESRPLSGEALEGAPAAGRVCQVDGFGEVHERLEAFDSEARTLRLTIREGLPFFVRSSEFRSRVIETGPSTCRFEVDQTMHISPFPGALLYPVLRHQLNKAVGMVLADLAHRSESGTVHPEKAAALRS